jgi:hypothetical protein
MKQDHTHIAVILDRSGSMDSNHARPPRFGILRSHRRPQVLSSRGPWMAMHTLCDGSVFGELAGILTAFGAQIRKTFPYHGRIQTMPRLKSA